MNRRTVVRRVTLSGFAAVGLVALGATSAMAHVTITPSTTAAGATAAFRVEIPHGCEESATTGISIRLPEGVADVTATGTDRWSVDEAADSLTWTTDEPLPDGEHAEVEFSVRLPDDVGATLVFPVIQECEDGEAAWTEVAEHGEGHDALDRPAPVVVVTSGGAEAEAEPETGETGETHGETANADPGGEAASTGPEAANVTAGPEAASATGDPEGPDLLIAYGAAGVLVAGGLAGGAVLLRRRRRQ
ncbi:YcnI family protein [Promicromonospora sp. NPDC023987]|uniref:YcnI family copper-binding membrane protein n=1 Tax=Promicromonospora sp. NPDC023987 TaxID=3155360 RepID=UPI0033F50FA4